MPTTDQGGSASLDQPGYWWYRARADLLRTILSDYVGEPARVLDVGSADGPSVSWLRGHGKQTCLDVDVRGLVPGDVCGSTLALPFKDSTFDVAAAFDVVEHCRPERAAIAELARVLAPGGRLLLSVPAYQWAWTEFDDQNGHHRRYTRRRAVAAVQGSGLRVVRATYAFGSMFPLFAADRLRSRVRERASRTVVTKPADVVALPQVSPAVERLLMGLARLDERVLRRADLPFGSSVVLVARKPEGVAA